MKEFIYWYDLLITILFALNMVLGLYFYRSYKDKVLKVLVFYIFCVALPDIIVSTFSLLSINILKFPYLLDLYRFSIRIIDFIFWGQIIILFGLNNKRLYRYSLFIILLPIIEFIIRKLVGSEAVSMTTFILLKIFTLFSAITLLFKYIQSKTIIPHRLIITIGIVFYTSTSIIFNIFELMITKPDFSNYSFLIFFTIDKSIILLFQLTFTFFLWKNGTTRKQLSIG